MWNQSSKGGKFGGIIPTISFISFSLSLRLCIHLSLYLSVFLSICLSIHLGLYLSVYLSIYLSICLDIYPAICLSLYLTFFLSISFLSLYLSLFFVSLSHLLHKQNNGSRYIIGSAVWKNVGRCCLRNRKDLPHAATIENTATQRSCPDPPGCCRVRECEV